jgi:hypothetical protein
MRRSLLLASMLALTACQAPPAATGCLTAADCTSPMVCIIGRCELPSSPDSGLDASLDAQTVDAPLPDGASADDASASDAGAVEDAATLADASGADASSPDAGSCPARPRLGLFVWDDDLVTTRDAILDLADAHGVTEIYLHANLFYVGDVGQDVLAAWISAAHARCIEVELLFGNAAWIHPTSSEATMRTAWAVSFAAAHPSARPIGVHWDLEPQQLPEWDSDPSTHPALVAELATVLEMMTPVAEAGGLDLTADIGFFLDGINVTRGGVTRPGDEWIIDAATRVVVLDFRDSAVSTGHGGMNDLAQAEMDYASSVDRPIVLAVETNPILPVYVTFAEEGFGAMTTQLGLVATHFTSSRAFTGFAIHDRDGLEALAP